jgi:chemotaxis protein MotB
MQAQRPIIVIKKISGHAGHHGGAWKVAYADFVTAMMALFIVLWLMNTSDHVKKAVAGYFNDPSGSSNKLGSDREGAGDNLAVTHENVQHVKEQIEQAIRAKADLSGLQKHMEMTITPEGLRIELLETKDGTFFQTGSTKLSESGSEFLQLLAGELKSLPNKLSIEGHTDALPYASTDGYTNWELSTDRANAARKLMQQHGLRLDQVAQVRGYANQQLRVKSNPLDPSNRRISLIVQYVEVHPPDAAKPPPPEAKKNKLVEWAQKARAGSCDPALALVWLCSY